MALQVVAMSFAVLSVGVRIRTGVKTNRSMVPFIEVSEENSTLLVHSSSGKGPL